jgi:hypothetical protein
VTALLALFTLVLRSYIEAWMLDIRTEQARNVKTRPTTVSVTRLFVRSFVRSYFPSSIDPSIDTSIPPFFRTEFRSPKTAQKSVGIRPCFPASTGAAGSFASCCWSSGNEVISLLHRDGSSTLCICPYSRFAPCLLIQRGVRVQGMSQTVCEICQRKSGRLCTRSARSGE